MWLAILEAELQFLALGLRRQNPAVVRITNFAELNSVLLLLRILSYHCFEPNILLALE